jgi:hypothetical protein
MHVIVRALVAALVLLLGTESVLWLRQGLSEQHSPGGSFLLLTAGAVGLILSVALLLGLLLMRPQV